MDRSERAGPAGGTSAGETGDTASELFRAFVRDGNRAALEAAVLQTAPAVRAAARRLTKPADVDDLVHDCLVVAIRRANAFAAGGRLLPWLLGILHNLARSRHRRRWARLLGTHHSDDAVLVAPATEEAGPAAAGERLDREAWVHTFQSHLANLAEPYRTVVRAHLLGGEPLVAIAARLERRPGTVRTQLARGLQELKRRLPAPLLAGVMGLLAVRDANAVTTTTSVAGSGRRMRVPAAVAAALAAIVLVAAFVLPSGPFDASSAMAGSPPVPATAATTEPIVSSEPAIEVAPRQQAMPTVVVRMSYAPSGAPVAGLPLMLLPRAMRGSNHWRTRARWRTVTTDADGIARFDAVPPGRTSLRTSDTDVVHAFEMGSEPHECSLTIQEQPPVIIEVSDEAGMPVAGAQLLLNGGSGRSGPGWIGATTGSDGSAVIVSAIPACMLRVMADGFAPSLTHVIVPKQPTTGSTEIELTRSSRCWRGSVRLPDGRAAEGASVAVWREPATKHTACFVLTDTAGEFSLPSTVGGVWNAAAWTSGCAPTLVTGLDDAAEPVLQLTPGGAIRGRIDRRDVPSASLLLVAAAPLATADNPLGQNGTIADADGNFRIAELAAGEHLVRFYATDVELGPPVRVTVADGADTTVELSPPARDAWVVRVIDDHGRALANCRVRAVDNRCLAQGNFNTTATTDRDGEARFTLGDGVPLDLHMHLPRRAAHDSLPAARGVGVPGRDLVLTVPDSARQPTRVYGQIVGTPKTGFQMKLMLSGSGGGRQFDVDDNGRMWTDDVPAGTYTLTAVCQDGRNAWYWKLRDVEVAAGADVDLGAIEPTVLTELSFVLPSAAAPAVVNTIVETVAGEAVARIDVASGEPVRLHLPAGDYRCAWARADATWHEHTVTLLDVPVQVELDHAGGRKCRIEVQPAVAPMYLGPLLGHLQGSGGSPCEVFFQPTHSRTAWAALIDLAPGRYSLSLTHGERTLQATLDVEAGEGQQAFAFTLR